MRASDLGAPLLITRHVQMLLCIALHWLDVCARFMVNSCRHNAHRRAAAQCIQCASTVPILYTA